MAWDAKLIATENWAWGQSIAGRGDLSGDGQDYLAVGTYSPTEGDPGTGGAVYVFDGGARESGVELKDDAADRVAGPITDGGDLGDEVALGDINGDGQTDLVVSDPYFYVGGPEDADQVLAENDGDDTFGDRLANVGDLDNDGLDDLAITGPWDDEGYHGAVWLYYGASLVP